MAARPTRPPKRKASRPKRDEVREARIQDEVVVDAHDSEEQAMGWYYYLEERLAFPFTARCVAERAISPLKVGDEVEVLRMTPEKECEHDMFVMIRWEKPGLGVPLSQLNPARDAGDETREAVGDWHYWVRQGYSF